MEAGLLVGSGGFYVARADPDTSTLFPHGTPSLVIYEIGLALRVGLGVDISAGPLSAGASITVFGIIQGAVGFGDSSGMSLSKPTDWLLQGQWGILGEI